MQEGRHDGLAPLGMGYIFPRPARISSIFFSARFFIGSILRGINLRCGVNMTF